MNDLIELDENHNKFLDKPNTLCRYEDIRTYQYNKVQINSANKYINASWIHIPYPNFFIATQGPLSHTTEDFWTMCDEYNVNIIVMLCKLKEQNFEKCHNYWNDKYMKNYQINIIEEGYFNKDKDIIIRRFQLINKIKKKISQYVTQIHLTSWEDHTALSVNYFDKIIKIIDLLKDNKNNAPIVVHCSAGVGRTGTFISLYNLYHEIMQQIFVTKNEVIAFSIFNLVRKMKEMRIFSIENENQFLLIYDFANYILCDYNRKNK